MKFPVLFNNNQCGFDFFRCGGVDGYGKVRINNCMVTSSNGHRPSLFVFVLLGFRKCEGIRGGSVFWLCILGRLLWNLPY